MAKYKRPGQTSTVKPGHWESKQSSKLSRSITFRMPRSLDDEWRNAILKTNRTQTEVLLSLMESYIKFANTDNREIDNHINNLMRQRESNDRTIVNKSLDDTIRRLQLQASRQSEDD